MESRPVSAPARPFDDRLTAALADPLAHGATVLKRNARRAVFHLDTALGPLVVKHYLKPVREGSLRRAKDWLRGSAARREDAAARALFAAGMPVPEPMAFWERPPQAPGVAALTAARAVEGGVPLGSFLEARFAPGDGRAAERRPWLSCAVDLLLRLHQAGFDHRDFHGGNVLVAPGAEPELIAIDLQRVACGQSVSPRRRVRALADLLHTLRFAIDPGDGAAAAERYLAAWRGAPADEFLHAVERSIDRRERARRRSRAARCTRESSRFTAVAAGGVRGFRRRDVPEHALFGAVAAARAAIERGGPELRSLAARSAVALCTADAGAGAAPLALAAKLYEGDGWRRGLRGRATRGRAYRAYVAAHRLLESGVPVAPVVAWLRTPDRSVFAAEEVLGSEPLSTLSFRLVPGGALAPLAAAVGRAVGRTLAALAKSGARIHDLSPKNVLIAAAASAPRAVLCDTDGTSFRRRPDAAWWIERLAQVNDVARGVPVRARLAALRELKRAVPALRRPGVARAVAARTAARRDRTVAPRHPAALAIGDAP